MRIEDLERASNKLFEQINDRISTLDSHVTNLKTRICRLREIIFNLANDRNRAIRLYSASFYPVDSSMELKFEPITYNQCVIVKSGPGYPTQTLAHISIEDGERSKSSRRGLFKFVDDITQPLVRGVKNQSRHPLEEIRSVSSLLVYRTYESRLVLGKGRSITSGSSLHDYAAKSNKYNKSLTAVDRHPNKPSSGGDAESYLGPVPDSILRYHQASMIEPDMFDTIDILNYEDSNLLTDDLPDILPSLSGIVKDVNKAYDDNDRSAERSFQDFSEPRETDGPTSLTGSLIGPPSPPTPPPMPNVPLHAVASIKLGTSQNIQEASDPLMQPKQAQPSPPPYLPPAQPLSSPKNQEVALSNPISPKALSGRDALMADIRLAASKPRAKTVKTAVPVATAITKEPSERNSIEAYQQEPDVTVSTGIPTPRSVFDSSNPRDSLLASIREAAGRPKRKVVPTARSRRFEEKRQDSGASDNGVNLMSDLVSKLRARRDGISGSFVANKSADDQQRATLKSVGSSIREAPKPADTLQQRMLTQVSSMIPARPSSSPSASNHDSEGDSNDFSDDDWK